jgi:general secretion pathway protein J
MLKRSTQSFIGFRGFTLIELLVAISLMALMTVLSWRGLDGISRSQLSLQQRADEVLTLQATLTQWSTDLDAISSQADMPGLDWDGRTLRILRHNSATPGEGLVVVAWARRVTDAQGYWLRWQSPALTTRGELDLAWQKAALWGQTPSDDDRTREVRTVGLDQWQIFYFRQNAWTNPLSSAGTAEGVSVNSPVPPASAPIATNTSAMATLPDGVRLALTLSAGQAVSGTLTRDWARPILGGSR